MKRCYAIEVDDFKNSSNDIAKNIRTIEWLKADILSSLSLLFKTMIKEDREEKVVDALASIIITVYVLGSRLGIRFSQLDIEMEMKLK